MNDIVNVGKQALQSLLNIEKAEKEMLKFPQEQCSVVHHFGPNICVREVSIPAGTLAIGHKQKFDHLNIMLRGKVMVLDDHGNTQTLTAPMIFVGKPGRKIGYILEDMVWQNVYSTELTDVNDVENFFIEKSENWHQDNSTKQIIEKISKEADRQDYLKVLEESGIPHEVARQQSENEDDQIKIVNAITRIADSPIEGKGLFLTTTVNAGDLICPARINGKRTQAGRYTNHSISPNAEMVGLSNGDINLIALKTIEGCKGGDLGSEILVDYRQSLKLTKMISRREILCQA
jgi:hypothetical protein